MKYFCCSASSALYWSIVRPGGTFMLIFMGGDRVGMGSIIFFYCLGVYNGGEL